MKAVTCSTSKPVIGAVRCPLGLWEHTPRPAARHARRLRPQCVRTCREATRGRRVQTDARGAPLRARLPHSGAARGSEGDASSCCHLLAPDMGDPVRPTQLSPGKSQNQEL